MRRLHDCRLQIGVVFRRLATRESARSDDAQNDKHNHNAKRDPALGLPSDETRLAGLEALALDAGAKALELYGADVEIAQKSDASGSYSQEFMEQIFAHPEWQDQPTEELDELIEQLLEQGKNEGHVSKNTSIRAMRVYIDVFRAGTESMPETLAELPPDELRQIIMMFFHGLSAEVP